MALKKCYYELLELEKNCSEEQIKKQYKKLAIKYHPDKNSNSDEAKEKFQEINEAYKVLSNPGERTWYDNHREQILNDIEQTSDQLKNFKFDIEPYINESLFEHDAPKGDPKNFYVVYSNLIENIKVEEEEFRLRYDLVDTPSYLKAPSLGNEDTIYEKKQIFYNYWHNFFTCKNFSWADKYKYEKDENRRINRLIEKENFKFRKAAKKVYMKDINKLIKIIEKNDYNWSNMLLKIREEEEEERIKKEKLEMERKQKWKENKHKLLEEEMKNYENEDSIHDENDDIHINETEVNCICNICDKELKNYTSFWEHTKNKAHKKALDRLAKDLQLTKQEKEELVESLSKKLIRVKIQEEEEQAMARPVIKLGKKNKKNKKANQDLEQELEVNPSLDKNKENIEDKLQDKDNSLDNNKEKILENLSEKVKIDINLNNDPKEIKKQLKINMKKAKNKAKKNMKNEKNKCTICKNVFNSKNNLFIHLKKEHSVN